MTFTKTLKALVCTLLCSVCTLVGAETLRIATLPAADSIVLDVAVSEGL